MRRETSRPCDDATPSAPPIACVHCGSDAFAVGPAAQHDRALSDTVDVDLRCGACGAWQRRRMTLGLADAFLDHMALTQARIARALAGAATS